MFHFLIYCGYAAEVLPRTRFSEIPKHDLNKDDTIKVYRMKISAYQLGISKSYWKNYVRFFLGGARVIVMPKRQICSSAESYENSLIISQPFDFLKSGGNNIVKYVYKSFFYDNELCKMLEDELFNINDKIENVIENGYPLFFKKLIKTLSYSDYFPMNLDSDELAAKDLWEDIYYNLKSDEDKFYATKLGLNIDRNNFDDDIDKKRDFIRCFYYAMCFPYTHAFIDIQDLLNEVKDDKGMPLKVKEGDLYFVEFNIIPWNKKNMEYCAEYKTISSDICRYMSQVTTSNNARPCDDEIETFVKRLNRIGHN